MADKYAKEVAGGLEQHTGRMFYTIQREVGRKEEEKESGLREWCKYQVHVIIDFPQYKCQRLILKASSAQ